MAGPARLTVLISGNGSNLQALIDGCFSGTVAKSGIVRVISNRKGARGLERAREAGIATHYHNLVRYGARFPSAEASIRYGDEARRAYDADLAALVLADDPDLVVCAGWMHVLSDAFLTPLARAGVPAINLHPALPGQFNGAAAIERAWRKARDDNLDRTGVMVHYVIAQVDCGEAIITEEVPLRRDESLEDLENRMHVVEHRLIVDGTRLALERLPEKKSDSSSSSISILDSAK